MAGGIPEREARRETARVYQESPLHAPPAVYRPAPSTSSRTIAGRFSQVT